MINYVLIFYAIFASVFDGVRPRDKTLQPGEVAQVVECEIQLHPASHILDPSIIARLRSDRLTFEICEGRLTARLMKKFKAKHSSFRGKTEFLFFRPKCMSDELVVFHVVFKEGAIFAAQGCFIRIVLPMACRIAPFRSYNGEKKWVSNGFLVSQGGLFARIDVGDLGYIVKGGFSGIYVDGVLSYSIREDYMEIFPAFKEHSPSIRDAKVEPLLNPHAPEFVPMQMEPEEYDTALEDALSVVYVDPRNYVDGWDFASPDALLAALRTDSKKTKKSSQYSV